MLRGRRHGIAGPLPGPAAGRPGCGPRALRAAPALLVAALLLAAVPASRADQRSLLLLPPAGAAPGQEWAGKALGAFLEERLGSLGAVRLVAGAAREEALRAMASRDTVSGQEFAVICRQAGAEFAVLPSFALAGDRLTLELRLFEAATAGERAPFRREDGIARAFALATDGVRHLLAEAGGTVAPAEEEQLSRPPAASLEAYGAYRGALRERAPEERVARLRRALELDPDYFEALLHLGAELYRQGSVAEALPFAERAAARGAAVPEARNNLGVILAAAERPADAEREFERAIELAPGYAEARLNLARVLEDRGKNEAAERQYAAVLEADPENAKARFGLAMIYDATGRPELAVREFRLLSPKRPEYAEGQFVTAGQEARKAREFAKAERHFLRAVEINPSSADAWSELGTNSVLAGEPEKGADYFRRAVAVDPQRADVRYYLGLALEKARKPDEAAREFRRAAELGGPPEARVRLARLALDAGDPGAAAVELERLLADHPDHAEGQRLLAQATAETDARRRLLEGQSRFAGQRLERLEEIVEDLGRRNRELEARLLEAVREKDALGIELRRERAAQERLQGELGRKIDEARGDLGALALELGRMALGSANWAQARRYLERAVEIDPRDAEAWSGLAEAYRRLGQGEKATAAQERVRLLR